MVGGHRINQVWVREGSVCSVNLKLVQCMYIVHTVCIYTVMEGIGQAVFLTRYRTSHNCNIFEHLTRYPAIADCTTSHAPFSYVVVKPCVWALGFYSNCL